MAGLQKQNLQDINFNSNNIFVVGLIIGKTEPIIFKSKQSEDEQLRGVITFTIRDNKRFFTNCKCWANKEQIEEYNEKFKIGDIIDIISPKIIPRISSSNQDDEKYQPMVPTQYFLLLNEHNSISSVIRAHIDVSKFVDELKFLKNIPIKSCNGILNLADINSDSLHIIGRHIDLLVIIKRMKSIRNVQTKSGISRQCLEIIVIDKSFTNGICLTIWHKEWIQRAQQSWESRHTVLHLVDIRVDYSEYYKSTILGLSNRTIIIENPNIKETEELKLFAITIPISDSDIFESGGNQLPPINSIVNVMTVQQIYDRAEGNLVNDDNEEFTAVLYAIITEFDLDGYSSIMIKKCKFCKRRLKQTAIYCDSEQCQLSISFDYTGEKFDYYFDINVHLTDHTGTLIEGKLSNVFAEKTLGLTITEFQKLSKHRKCTLKWKFLLERFVIKLLVRKKSAIRSKMYILLMELTEIHINDVAEKILVY